MSHNAIDWTPERRRTHAEATLEGKRRAAEERRTRPCHVDRWRREGSVSAGLEPIVEDRARQVAEMVSDLGGPNEVSAMERGILDGWYQAMVAADAQFARFVRDENHDALERLSTFINSARASLLALGLHRRAKNVTPSLSSYLDGKTRDATEDGSGSTIENGRGSDVTLEGEVTAEEETS